MKDRTVPWLTSAEAARHLGKSVGAFHVWLHRKRAMGQPVRVHWLDGRMRFRQTDLDRCVEPERAPGLKLVRGGR